MKLDKSIVSTIVISLVIVIIIITSYSEIIPTTQSTGDTMQVITTFSLSNSTEDTGESFTQNQPFNATVTNTSPITQIIEVGNNSNTICSTSGPTLISQPDEQTCAYLGDGTYSVTKWDSNVIDGNSASSDICGPSDTCILEVNYTVPSTHTGDIIWRVIPSSGGLNLTVNASCATENPISLRVIDDNPTGTDDGYYCYNGSTYIFILDTTVPRFYEEFIYFNLTAQYTDTDFTTSSFVTIEDNTTLTGNVFITYTSNVSTSTGNNIPLGGLFGSTGMIFVVIMGSLLFVIVKFINLKNN